MRDNEALLVLYLARLDANEVVFPGGFRVGGDPSPDRGIGVEKLASENPFEQLVLPVDEREAA